MSELLVPSRRGFLGLMASAIAMPAIVKFDLIMPVKAQPIVLATVEDMERLGHVSTELAQAGYWAKTASTIVTEDHQVFRVHALIGMPAKANRIDDVGLTDKLIHRFIRERMLEKKDTEGSWNSIPFKKLVAPRHWFDENFRYKET